MILKFEVQVNGKKVLKYVPKAGGSYLRFCANLWMYVKTKDPDLATRVSTREKAVKILEDYKRGNGVSV